jgi:hypothetical protein
MLKLSQIQSLASSLGLTFAIITTGCGSSSNNAPPNNGGGNTGAAGAGNPGGGSPNPGGGASNPDGGAPNPGGGAPNPGGGAGGSSNPGALGVTIAPAQTALFVGETTQFTAVIDGSSAAGVTWSVKEGADGGVITAGGSYTAPAKAGTFHVLATSKADATKSGSAEVVVSPKSGVDVVPRGAGVPAGGAVTFTCSIDGKPSSDCSWAVKEAGGGTISATGAYTAPATSGLYHVVATSKADATKTGNGSIWVLPAGTGTSGQLTDQTKSVSVQFGDAQSVVVDPIRQNELYGFVDTDGYAKGGPISVIKSTDYGVTWKAINATKFGGLAWGVAIDTNPARDPGTPPTLYSPAGYGDHGVYKSVDGGVTWKQLFAAGSPLDKISAYGGLPDAYSVTVLPDNPPNHILITFHGGWKDNADGGLAESMDGGVSWVLHPPPAGFGISNYVVAVDAMTWLVIAQDNGGANGMWKTSTAGRAGGVISTSAWKRVDTIEHPHGSFQPLVTTDAVYIAGFHGIKRSKDKGDTWTSVYDFGGEMSSVVATGSYMYANHLTVPNLVRASRQADSKWDSYATVPGSLIKGAAPFGTATCTDGSHWYMIMNAGDSGLIWRYTE